MRQATQDYSAGRIQPAKYDTILPPDVRSELLQPRRARILGIPPPPPQKPPQAKLARFWMYPALGWSLALLALMIVIAVAMSWPSAEQLKKGREESADRSRSAEEKADEAIKALRSSSTAPTVQPTPTATSSGVVPLPAPRAMLVKLPPPRAELIKLPPWQIDESRLLQMPYGERVVGTLRGFLTNENRLPRVGQIGDTWIVGNTPWVWLTVPGTSAPAWIDP
jgi:hypothetical protein